MLTTPIVNRYFERRRQLIAALDGEHNFGAIDLGLADIYSRPDNGVPEFWRAAYGRSSNRFAIRRGNGGSDSHVGVIPPLSVRGLSYPAQVVVVGTSASGTIFTYRANFGGKPLADRLLSTAVRYLDAEVERILTTALCSRSARGRMVSAADLPDRAATRDAVLLARSLESEQVAAGLRFLARVHSKAPMLLAGLALSEREVLDRKAALNFFADLHRTHDLEHLLRAEERLQVPLAVAMLSAGSGPRGGTKARELMSKLVDLSNRKSKPSLKERSEAVKLIREWHLPAALDLREVTKRRQRRAKSTVSEIAAAEGQQELFLSLADASCASARQEDCL